MKNSKQVAETLIPIIKLGTQKGHLENGVIVETLYWEMDENHIQVLLDMVKKQLVREYEIKDGVIHFVLVAGTPSFFNLQSEVSELYKKHKDGNN